MGFSNSGELSGRTTRNRKVQFCLTELGGLMHKSYFPFECLFASPSHASTILLRRHTMPYPPELVVHRRDEKPRAQRDKL